MHRESSIDGAVAASFPGGKILRDRCSRSRNNDPPNRIAEMRFEPLPALRRGHRESVSQSNVELANIVYVGSVASFGWRIIEIGQRKVNVLLVGGRKVPAETPMVARCWKREAIRSCLTEGSLVRAVAVLRLSPWAYRSTWLSISTDHARRFIAVRCGQESHESQASRLPSVKHTTDASPLPANARPGVVGRNLSGAPTKSTLTSLIGQFRLICSSPKKMRRNATVHDVASDIPCETLSRWPRVNAG